MSSSTTSISRDSMIRNPSATDLQSATTSKPGSAWSSRETLSRNNAWSSMSSKRIFFAEVLLIGGIFLETSSRKTDRETTAFFARLKSKISAGASQNRARDIESQTIGIGSALEWLE